MLNPVFGKGYLPKLFADWVSKCIFRMLNAGLAGQKDSSTVTIDFTSDPKGCAYTLNHTLSPEWSHMVGNDEGSWRLISEKLEHVLNKAGMSALTDKYITH